eukprot:TRINITY_DN17838_c0_g1_i1.p1 TRINITY_DN17838_c0_g1~~TRINITY_DN17838_c0_g1_i1.p1  ORF type:complete len:192 (-),score=34.26 TRINITY_DN17838_c0_g1_i1:38-613(-)
MKTIHASQNVSIPSDVTITVKSRVVTVKGPRGTLVRAFKHANVQLEILGKGAKKRLQVTLWFGDKASLATIRTICSHVQNLITGVTKGFQYKMRFVYAHFPVNCNIPDDGSFIEIHNFLGEKVVRRVVMPTGVKIERSSDVKDEIVLRGNSIEAVSQCAAKIHQSTLVKNKDIRKFLDGIYVSEKGAMEVV